MEMATIEQIHRMSKLPIYKLDKLPALHQLSRDERLTPRSCAMKEFRFPPPFTGKKKKTKKKLPPISENAFPKRHNTVEDLDVMNIHHLAPLPEIRQILTISEHGPSQGHVKEEDEDAQSEGGKPNVTFGCVREFTFPVSSAKRKRDRHVLKKSKLKELPIQAKIERLARKKRKTRKTKEVTEGKHQAVSELKCPVPQNTTAFKARRDRQTDTLHGTKESKSLGFKHPVTKPDEVDRPRVPHRLYTQIADSIYTYSRGTPHDFENRFDHRREPLERLPVTPVTAHGDRDNLLRPSNFSFPPIL